jgi:hypothetical protein
MSIKSRIGCAGEINLAFLGPPSRTAQGVKNVGALKIWIIAEQFVDRAAGADLPDDHPDSHALPADAWLAAHNRRVLGDAEKVVHGGAYVTAIACPQAYPTRTDVAITAAQRLHALVSRLLPKALETPSPASARRKRYGPGWGRDLTAPPGHRRS